MGPPRPASRSTRRCRRCRDQPPTDQIDTADLTVLQDDGVEVLTASTSTIWAEACTRPYRWETSADDTAVTIYRPRKDAQVLTNWTVDALEELVTRTPFLSSEGTVVFTGKLLSDVVSDETNCPQGIICAAQDDNSKALIERRTWTLEALDRASGELLWRATASRLGDQVGTNTSSAVTQSKKRPLFATVTETAAAVAACTLAAMNQDATALVPLNAQPAIFCPPPSRFFSLTAILMLLSAAVAMSYGLSYARKNTVQRVPRIVAERGSGFLHETSGCSPKACGDWLQLAQRSLLYKGRTMPRFCGSTRQSVLPTGVAQIAVEASLCTLQEALSSHKCQGLPSELQLS